MTTIATSSPALDFRFTRVGVARLFALSGDGLDFRLTHVSLGDAPGYAPTGLETALRGERQRLPVSGARLVEDVGFEVSVVVAASAPTYRVREIGLHLEDGTLLALWSQAPASTGAETALVETNALIPVLLAFQIVVIPGLPEGNWTFPDTAILFQMFFSQEFAAIGEGVTAMAAALMDLADRVRALERRQPTAVTLHGQVAQHQRDLRLITRAS